MEFSTGTIVALALILIVLAALAGMIAKAVYETRENRLTTCALLRVTSEDNQRLVRIDYGQLHMPFTFGNPTSIRVRVPDRVIPNIATPEDATEAGIRLQQSLGMDDSTTNLSRPRWHEWNLS